MGSLLENPWLLSLLGLVLEFLLLSLTYRAGYAAGFRHVAQDLMLANSRVLALQKRLDYMAAENDVLLARIRALKAGFPVGQIGLVQDRQQRLTEQMRRPIPQPEGKTSAIMTPPENPPVPLPDCPCLVFCAYVGPEYHCKGLPQP